MKNGFRDFKVTTSIRYGGFSIRYGNSTNSQISFYDEESLSRNKLKNRTLTFHQKMKRYLNILLDNKYDKCL